MSDPLSRVRRAAAKAALARETFETEIRRAVQERTMRQVAQAAGLSAARIHQIVHARRGSQLRGPADHGRRAWRPTRKGVVK
jgi:hypothetical protein